MSTTSYICLNCGGAIWTKNFIVGIDDECCKRERVQLTPTEVEKIKEANALQVKAANIHKSVCTGVRRRTDLKHHVR
jgi:hypothetical protein